MNTVLWISAITNMVLGVGLVAAFRAFQRDRAWAGRAIREQHEATQRARADADQMHAEYCALGQGVATTLQAIREDLDRNYHHTHDGHVLDRIAYRLREVIAGTPSGAHEVHLDEYCAREVESMGGKVSEHGAMTLGQMLDFGWRLHTLALERSNQLIAVVRQPCGNSDHAGWLSKTLAIYELMCARDKDLAVRRLSAVVEAWRYAHAEVAPRYVEDIR